MWLLQTPWYDPVLKGVILFFFAFFLTQLMGKKHISRLSPFNLVIIIISSEVILNSIIVFNNLLANFITAFVIICLHFIFNELINFFPAIEKMIVGQPVVIILNGKIFKKVLRSQKMTESDLFTALREHEVMGPEDVKCAILEKDGNISVIKYTH